MASGKRASAQLLHEKFLRDADSVGHPPSVGRQMGPLLVEEVPVDGMLVDGQIVDGRDLEEGKKLSKMLMTYIQIQIFYIVYPII
jgi:hypothetical protein